MPATPLAETLRAARLAKQINQAQLAHLVGCNPNSICQWELGRRPVAPRFVVPLANALGLDAEKIFAQIPRRSEEKLTAAAYAQIVCALKSHRENVCERSLYQESLRRLVRLVVPADEAAAVLAQYEADLEKARQAAEKARLYRLEQKQSSVASGT